MKRKTKRVHWMSEHHQDGVWRFLPRNNWQPRVLSVPRFNNCDRKGRLAVCQIRQLMGKFEGMATKIGLSGVSKNSSTGKFTLRWSLLFTKNRSGDGPMTVDPVFRAVAHTGNVRDLLLAESPASGNAPSDQCSTACTAIMPERYTQTDKAEVEREV